MRKRSKMRARASKKNFTRNATRINPRNNVQTYVMRGGIRF